MFSRVYLEFSSPELSGSQGQLTNAPASGGIVHHNKCNLNQIYQGIQHLKPLFMLINRHMTSDMAFSRQQQKHEQNNHACKQLMPGHDLVDHSLMFVDSLVGQ